MAGRNGDAQAQGPGLDRYANLIVTTRSGRRVCRRIRVVSDAHTLAVVQALHADVGARLGSDVVSVDILDCSRKDFEDIAARSVYFANICGKVTHCQADYMLRPEVLPLVVEVHNNFGRAFSLYGPECNLQTSSTNTVTLFRAARSSRGVAAALDLALNPESIAKCEVYMIVASARLAHPVHMQSGSIEHALVQDERWRAACVVKTEDGAHIKSVQLTGLDPGWVSSLGAGLQVPSNILVNITKNGGVNMFMSVHEQFRIDLENEYLPLYQAVVDVVAGAS